MCILEEPWSFDLVNGDRDLLTGVPFFLRLQSAGSQRSPIRCKHFKTLPGSSVGKEEGRRALTLLLGCKWTYALGRAMQQYLVK